MASISVTVIGNGDHVLNDKSNDGTAAWAVRAGDVLAVPEPATGVLLAAGLGGLGLARRRRRPGR